MEKAEIVVMNSPAWGFPAGSDIDVGLNGTPYKIQEGKTVKVPVGVLENLEHAVVRIPKTDDKGQILFDKRKKMIWETHKRYIVQVLKDPRMKRKPSESIVKTEQALENVDDIDDDDDEVVVEEDRERKGFIDRILNPEKE